MPSCLDEKEGGSVTWSVAGASAASRGLPKKRGGRNSKYKANMIHDKSTSRARGALTQYYAI